MYFNITVFKPVGESWYGNFKIEDDKRFEDVKLVKVSIQTLKTNPVIWRVSVWGNDDHGVEYDTPDETKAKELFNKVIMTKNLTHEWVRVNGFINA